jgi:polyhydroxyalkanoate synthesis repressor PhaR
MHSIKKYANRKLYHTNRKQYITLDGIAELIQAGEQVQVIDNESGDDITAPILAQVVLQARGRSKSALPTHLLTDLIQAGGDTISGLRRSVWAAISGESSIDTEIRRRLQQLVTEGLLSAEEGARMLRMMVRSSADESGRALLDLPTSGDVARLRSQVEELAAAVEQLLAERHGAQQHTSAALPAPLAAGRYETGFNGADAARRETPEAGPTVLADPQLPAPPQREAGPEAGGLEEASATPAAPEPEPAARPRSGARKSGTAAGGATGARTRRRKSDTGEA